jgi:hypothetical protein
MNRYYTRYDGNNEEGLGSILQSQLHLYAYCRLNKSEQYFPGFVNISHFQYTNQTKEEFNDSLNRFFNIPSTSEISEIKYIDPNFLIRDWGEKNNHVKIDYIPELYQYINYTGINYFDKNKLSMSLHIRNINSQDVCFNQNREYYSKQKKKYFLNLISNINKKHGDNLDIHIFSQGQESEFLEFNDNFNTTLHLNENLITTFYHLMTSDILITSNSSLSWTAHLYNKNKFVYSRNNFFHSWYPSTFFIDFDGNFIKI